MNPLEPPDSYHLSAAEGWLALGSASEALVELEKIITTSQNHSDVLFIRWHAFASLKNWKACVDVGRRLIEAAPDQVSSWQNYANSLFYEKRYQEAFDVLFPAVQKFPAEWSIPYNLACYQCQLGKLEDALFWFRMALTLGEADVVKKHGLKDPDLNVLWSAIRKL